MTTDKMDEPADSAADPLEVPYSGFSIRSDLIPARKMARASHQETGPWLVASQARTRLFEYPGRLLGDPKYPPLHRRLARTRLDDGAIRKQASRIGFLGEVTRLVEPGPGRSRVLDGERVDYWRSEVSTLKILIELWDRAIDSDSHSLRAYVSWKYSPRLDVSICLVVLDGKLLDTQSKPLRVLIDRYEKETKQAKAHRNLKRIKALAIDLDVAIVKLIRELEREYSGERLLITRARMDAADLTEGDSVGPVRAYVVREVNLRLRELVYPEIGDARLVQMRLVPRTALADAYLAFAQEICTGVPARRVCRRIGCEETFDWKSKRLYCSDPCRNLDGYYRRKGKKAADELDPG